MFQHAKVQKIIYCFNSRPEKITKKHLLQKTFNKSVAYFL